MKCREVGGFPQVEKPECGVLVEADGPTDGSVKGLGELVSGGVSCPEGVDDGPLRNIEITVDCHDVGGDGFDPDEWEVFRVYSGIATQSRREGGKSFVQGRKSF